MYKCLFLLTLVLNFSYSQNRNCYVEYTLKIFQEEGLFKNNEFLYNSLQKTINNKEEINFILEINNLGSKFYFDSQSSKAEERVRNFANNLASYSGIIYKITNDSILRQSSLLGKDIFVKENIERKWNFINESKYIDSYLCFKAVSEKIINYDEKTFKFPITAWYCPQLPYNYGPNGYGNLPGLILELQVRNALFGMKYLSIDKICDFNLDFLKKIKIVTPEELEKKLIEFNNFEGK